MRPFLYNLSVTRANRARRSPLATVIEGPRTTMGLVAITSMLSVGLLAAVLAAVTWTLRRRRRNDLLARLRADWGQLRDRGRDYPSLVDFHHARKDDGPSIDDRTWDDLHLDAVFTVLDHTQSAIGQQALYTDCARRLSDQRSARLTRW